MIPCRIPIRFSLIKSLSVSMGAADFMRSLSGEYFNAPATKFRSVKFITNMSEVFDKVFDKD